MTSQIILPQQYDSTSVYDLLRATELGRIGFDLRLLRSLTDRREEALPTLAKWVEEPRHEDRLLDLEEQCFDLFRYFRAAEAVPFYMRLVKGNPAEIPDDLVEAFSELGAPALEAVLQLHSEVDPDDRADIAFLLAAMGVHDDRVKAIFLDTLASDKYEGALCIGLYGDTSLRPLVSESLASLPDNAKEERNALKAAIDELDSVGQREEAPEYDIFSLYPATSAPLFHVLAPEDVLPFLTCDSSEYRAAAAASFCDDAYEDDVRDALMEQATTDDSVEVRAAALRALGERIDDDVVLALIEKTLGDTSAPEEVRAGALIGLAGAPASALFQREVQAFYDNDETRAAALEAMWRSLDGRYKKHFAPNLRHDDEEVRSQAIQGVGAFPLGDLAIELVPFFQDETHREESLFAYALAVPGTITPKSANKFFDRIEDRAGGMTESESEVVAVALDRRLEREGYRPHFFPDDEDEHDHDHDHGAAVKHHDQPVRSEKVGRNDPCPCGSGKKYKKCHGAA